MKLKRIGGILALGAVLASCSSDAPDAPVKERTLEPNAEMREFITSQNEAAFGMFADIYSQADETGTSEHMAYSPLSFSTVFSLVANGAEGETLNDMMKGINCENMPLESVNGFCAEMTRNFSRIDPAVDVAFANSVWTDNSLTVNPAFREAVEKYYDSAILSCDFSSLEAPRLINTWVSNHTNGYIPEFFDPDKAIEGESAVVNTLYFKAPWIDKFDKDNTKNADFYNLSGSSVKTPMMSSVRQLDYAETDEALMASLDMGGETDSPTFTFSLIMPKEGKDFKSMVAAIDNAKLQSMRQQMTKRTMTFKMPRFKVESEAELSTALKNRGVLLPFDRVNAQFNIFNGMPWYFNKVTQKVSFCADEEGATAAAATTITMSGAIGPTPTLEFNRPFVYVVTENATGAILFMGVITSL